MNTVKLNFIPLVSCLVFFLSKFLGIHDQILSLNTHVDLSLIKLSSPRRFLRLCCCSSSCSSDDSCFSSSSNRGSVDTGNPTQSRFVWFVTSNCGGFGQGMPTEPPRTQEGDEDCEKSEVKSSCCSSSSCKSKKLESNNGGSNGDSNNDNNSGGNDGRNGPLNPYGGYNGRLNPTYTTD
ncbi:Signal peptide containing protein [Cryptosporidium tyzzeri]|nr:Signal peptide containing protein [Cryptosporidium tyzzeri]